LEISVFRSSAGYCTRGVTVPRMKSTSETRSPHDSASRSPARAPSRTAARSLLIRRFPRLSPAEVAGLADRIDAANTVTACSFCNVTTSRAQAPTSMTSLMAAGEFVTPAGYGHLSLALVDAVYSIRSRYASVKRVVAAYCEASLLVPPCGRARRAERGRSGRGCARQSLKPGTALRGDGPCPGGIAAARSLSAGIVVLLAVLIRGQFCEPVEQLAERVPGGDGLPVRLRDPGLPRSEAVRPMITWGWAARNLASRNTSAGSSGSSRSVSRSAWLTGTPLRSR